MSETESSRREFLRNATKVGVVAAIGIGVVGCGSSGSTSANLTKGKSKKEELLYQKSAHWDAYYKSC